MWKQLVQKIDVSGDHPLESKLEFDGPGVVEIFFTPKQHNEEVKIKTVHELGRYLLKLSDFEIESFNLKTKE